MTFIFFYNLYNIAGLPPLLLFGSKFILLSYLHETGDNFVLFSFLLFSILSMFYYLRVLKVIFFDVGYSSGGITLNNKFAFLIAGLSVASFACNLYLFFEILS
jgi:NADH:ubiquinone oxidoreductase subunit 2 (subunit N)